MSALFAIQTVQPYRHQGELLHPKLVYAVPEAVAEGLVGLGLAARSAQDADVELPFLTWDDVVASSGVQPAPIVSDQSGL